jgi:thioredoxin-related protein
MKCITPLLLFGLLALPAAAQERPLNWSGLGDAFRQAELRGVSTLVYVDAAWCGPCRRLETETLEVDAIRVRLGRFARARIAIDAHDTYHTVGGYRLSEADWAARLGAATTPTLVLLGPDGALLGRHIGFVPPQALAPILDAALSATR